MVGIVVANVIKEKTGDDGNGIEQQRIVKMTNKEL